MTFFSWLDGLTLDAIAVVNFYGQALTISDLKSVSEERGRRRQMCLLEHFFVFL